MGKKKVLSEKNLRVMEYPNENDVLGVVLTHLGNDRFQVKCQDGHMRVCRIRVKRKRRTWVREGNIVLVSPWDFQSEEGEEIFHRYTESQASDLRKNGILRIE